MRTGGSLGRFCTRALIAGCTVTLALVGPVSVRVVEALETGSVSGTVRNANGDPVAGMRVGIPATGSSFLLTNSSGAYVLSGIPQSASPYDVQLLAPCTRDQVKRVVVDGAETVDFTIPSGDGGDGYTCTQNTTDYIDGTSFLGLTGDNTRTSVGLPFAFPFFGTSYTSAFVHSNGFINFVGDPTRTWSNSTLPDDNVSDPNAGIYAFWDDLNLDGQSSTRIASGGAAPNRFFVVEWLDATFVGAPQRVTFEIMLFESGRIVLQYKDINPHPDDIRERGTSATVGIENEAGTAAVQRLYNQPLLDNALGIEFAPAQK